MRQSTSSFNDDKSFLLLFYNYYYRCVLTDGLCLLGNIEF